MVVTRQSTHTDDTITFIAEVSRARDEVAARLRESDAVLEVGEVGSSMVLIRKRSCGATPIIRKHNGLLFGLNYAYGTERVFDILTFNRATIRAIVDAFGAVGTAELERIAPVPDHPAGLSERQYEVVMAAVTAGYYDWPRRTEVERIAAELGIAHSTFLEHLRKAERKLIMTALPSHGTTHFDDISTRSALSRSGESLFE